jgi:hypothetical protein
VFSYLALQRVQGCYSTAVPSASSWCRSSSNAHAPCFYIISGECKTSKWADVFMQARFRRTICLEFYSTTRTQECKWYFSNKIKVCSIWGSVPMGYDAVHSGTSSPLPDYIASLLEDSTLNRRRRVLHFLSLQRVILHLMNSNDSSGKAVLPLFWLNNCDSDGIGGNSEENNEVELHSERWRSSASDESDSRGNTIKGKDCHQYACEPRTCTYCTHYYNTITRKVFLFVHNQRPGCKLDLYKISTI